MNRYSHINQSPLKISIVDRDREWLMLCGEALRKKPYSLVLINDYELGENHIENDMFDPSTLIILGCVRAKNTELEFVSNCVRKGYAVLVFCTTLSHRETLTLFREGAANVYVKPFNKKRIAACVEETVDLLRQRASIQRASIYVTPSGMP